MSTASAPSITLMRLYDGDNVDLPTDADAGGASVINAAARSGDLFISAVSTGVDTSSDPTPSGTFTFLAADGAGHKQTLLSVPEKVTALPSGNPTGDSIFTVAVRAGSPNSAALAKLPDGLYTVEADVQDQAGHSAPEVSRQILVDTTADAGTPTTLVVNTSADDVINAIEAHAVNFTVAGLDSDASAVAMFTDGTHRATATIVANGSNTVDLTGFNGAVSSSLTITDIHQNTTSVTGNDVTLSSTAAAVDQSSFGELVHDVTTPGGAVYALYEGLLGRAPDTAGLQIWTAALDSGASLHDVTAAILSSPEAQSHLTTADATTFVEQLYHSVLGRDGDAIGVQNWVSALANGTSQADVADSFVFSAEHIGDIQPALDAGIFVPDQNAINVAQLYYGLLGRAPDAGGLQSFTAAVESGSTSLHDVAQALVNSAEYASNTTTLTDSAYVQNAYEAVLGRAADASGLQTWTSALDSGTDRASVVAALVDSGEFQGQYAGQSSAAYVEGLYEHVLGRQGDTAGVQGWANLLDSHTESRVDVANAFVNSPEFQAHLTQLAGGQNDSAFVESLYQNALGRQADAGGLQTWTDALAHGTSRADVAVAIAESTEAQQHLAAQIQQSYHVA